MKKITVLIVDDHKIVRLGVAALLSQEPDFEVVGEADDGTSALRAVARLHPAVVILDLMMPGPDGAETTEEIARRFPETKVVLLTSFSTSDGISRALEQGALGAVLKTADDKSLVKAIRKAAAGERYLSKEVEQLLVTDPPIKPLSPRQAEVLQSLVHGLTNRDIATQLGICEARVEELVSSLQTKIGAANRTEAVAIALRKHLLKI